MPETPQPILAQGPGEAIVRKFEHGGEDQAAAKPRGDDAFAQPGRQGAPDLVSVISTDVLSRRPSRPPDYAAENRALVALAQEMANSPDGILQKLADTALVLCRAHSAGLSLLEKEDQGRRFHWRAVAGRWASHLGGGTPRDFGPCGTVLDRNVALLFSHPERDFPYFGEVDPLLEEGLLIPFYVEGEAVGTIWVVTHDEKSRFDAEDFRVMTNLGIFAGAAYQSVQSLKATIKASQELQRFAALVESSNDAIVSKDLDGVIATWNRGAERLFGYAAEEAVGKPITILIPPEDHGQEADILARIRRGEHIAHYETVRQRKDGSRIDVSLTVSPIRNAAGQITGASKIARDISERRLFQEQQALLLREMSHRVRNLFTVTNSVVSLSARHARTPQDMATAVRGRLDALTRAYELTRPGLIEAGDLADRETTLHALIETILAPYVSQDCRRITVGGCDVPIARNAITSFALFLHELATNAAKYGALSAPEGGVRIDCSVEQDHLVLTWREQGGPPLDGPPDREGFGSLLTRRVVTGHLGGKHSSEWRPEGLAVHVAVPLERLAG